MGKVWLETLGIPEERPSFLTNWQTSDVSTEGGKGEFDVCTVYSQAKLTKGEFQVYLESPARA